MKYSYYFNDNHIRITKYPFSMTFQPQTIVIFRSDLSSTLGDDDDDDNNDVGGSCPLKAAVQSAIISQ